MKDIKHFKSYKDMKVDDLVKQFSNLAFQARALGETTDIIEEMISDKNCKIFLSLSGAMVPGGMKKIIVDMMKDNWIDVLVTTGANLTHDLIETLGFTHDQGSHLADDTELNKKKIDRMYDVFLNDKGYAELEKWLAEFYKKLPEKKHNIKELLYLMGKNVSYKDSILKVAADKKIPIFCPAIQDSAIGFQTWNYIMNHKLDVDVFNDMIELMEITWTSDSTGAIIIGGGVPKDYVLQAMQFSPKKHNYVIQITMDRPEQGGASGAPLKEAISWGKVGEKAKYCNLICDATIALPIIHAALKTRLK